MGLYSLSALLLFISLLAAVTSCRSKSPEAVDPPGQCEIKYRENWTATDYEGVRLSPDYQLVIQGKSSPEYDKASAKEAADLFGRFHENPLSKMPDCVSETYRLTWVPSFHRTTIVRMWSSIDGRYVTIKRLERTSENRNGSTFTETTRRLSDLEWESTVNSINAYDFWNVASMVKESLPNDGADWLVEGHRKDKYHNIFRISPGHGLTQVIRNLFALTGEKTEIDKYLPDEALH